MPLVRFLTMRATMTWWRPSTVQTVLILRASRSQLYLSFLLPQRLGVGADGVCTLLGLPHETEIVANTRSRMIL